MLLGKLICAAAPLTVLEGHRVACMEIPKGGALTSWGTAFGFANIDLHPGEYCCNLKVLKVLRARRSVTWELPPEPTFDDMLLPKTTLDEAKTLYSATGPDDVKVQTSGAPCNLWWEAYWSAHSP